MRFLSLVRYDGLAEELPPPSLEAVVQSTPLYHFFDSAERVPSACMSSTILPTASLRLCESLGSFLSNAIDSGSYYSGSPTSLILPPSSM